LFNGILDENELEHIILLQYGMMLLVSFNRKLVPRKILLDAKKPLIGILLKYLREEYHADLLAIKCLMCGRTQTISSAALKH
jgi:hypothetical protein